VSGLVGGSAVVTGGGSGIGRAIALGLAADGASVAAIDIHVTEAQATVREIEQNGGRAVAIEADISVEGDVDRAISGAVAALGPLGIAVSAAGVLDGYLSIEETDPELWEKVLAINLTGTYLVCRRALAEMLPLGRGRIINLASAAGMLGDGGGAAYIVSKHGVIGLTRHIAVRHSAAGLTANAICPGPIGTNLRSNSTEILGPGAPFMEGVGLAANPELIKTVIPAGRRGTPDEVAAVARFLASEAAGYVTGQTLVVDGGWVAH
jgi:NAD(P)-dependent dehydrogenase (short-subunit alcohol dehydrogenase family)